jgi:hypothetical protein
MPRITRAESGVIAATWDPAELGLLGATYSTGGILSALVAVAGWPALALYWTITGTVTTKVDLAVFDGFDPAEIQRVPLAASLALGSGRQVFAIVASHVRLALATTGAGTNTVTAWLYGRSA